MKNRKKWMMETVFELAEVLVGLVGMIAAIAFLCGVFQLAVAFVTSPAVRAAMLDLVLIIAGGVILFGGLSVALGRIGRRPVVRYRRRRSFNRERCLGYVSADSIRRAGRPR